MGVSPLENKSSVVFNSLDMIKVGDVGLEDAIMKKLMEKLSLFPTVQHKCHNCGAIVEIDENKVCICEYYDGSLEFVEFFKSENSFGYYGTHIWDDDESFIKIDPIAWREVERYKK